MQSVVIDWFDLFIYLFKDTELQRAPYSGSQLGCTWSEHEHRQHRYSTLHRDSNTKHKKQQMIKTTND